MSFMNVFMISLGCFKIEPRPSKNDLSDRTAIANHSKIRHSDRTLEPESL